MQKFSKQNKLSNWLVHCDNLIKITSYINNWTVKYDVKIHNDVY